MVIELVVKQFEDRFVQASSLIKKSGIECSCIGVFGSFARGDYNAMSDIDFVMIPAGDLDMNKVYTLKSKLDDIKCDLALLSKEAILNPEIPFTKAVKRDIVIVYGSLT